MLTHHTMESIHLWLWFFPIITKTTVTAYVIFFYFLCSFRQYLFRGTSPRKIPWACVASKASRWMSTSLVSPLEKAAALPCMKQPLRSPLVAKQTKCPKLEVAIIMEFWISKLWRKTLPKLTSLWRSKWCGIFRWESRLGLSSWQIWVKWWNQMEFGCWTKLGENPSYH